MLSLFKSILFDGFITGCDLPLNFVWNSVEQMSVLEISSLLEYLSLDVCSLLCCEMIRNCL
jgi:hypothetical protein